MTADDPWETRPRLLQELCEGHGSYMLEVYALDLPNGYRTWVCRGCWLDQWAAAGRPEQVARR